MNKNKFNMEVADNSKDLMQIVNINQDCSNLTSEPYFPMEYWSEQNQDKPDHFWFNLLYPLATYMPISYILEAQKRYQKMNINLSQIMTKIIQRIYQFNNINNLKFSINNPNYYLNDNDKEHYKKQMQSADYHSYDELFNNDNYELVPKLIALDINVDNLNHQDLLRLNTELKLLDLPTFDDLFNTLIEAISIKGNDNELITFDLAKNDKSKKSSIALITFLYDFRKHKQKDTSKE